MNGVGGGEVGGQRMGWGRGHGDYGTHRGSCWEGGGTGTPSFISPSDLIFCGCSNSLGTWALAFLVWWYGGLGNTIYHLGALGRKSPFHSSRSSKTPLSFPFVPSGVGGKVGGQDSSPRIVWYSGLATVSH